MLETWLGVSIAGKIADTALGGICSNRVDALVAKHGSRLKRVLLEDPHHPVNHHVLLATQTAYILSLQAFAKHCLTRFPSVPAGAATWEERQATSRLVDETGKLQADKPLPDWTPALRQVEDDAETVFGRADNTGALSVVAGRTLAALEKASGPLPATVVAFFHYGDDAHDSWMESFTILFAHQVKTNPPVQAITTYAGLAELKALGFDLAAAVAEVDATTRRTEAKVNNLSGEVGQLRQQMARLLQRIEGTPEAQAATVAGISAEAFVKLAQSISTDISNPDQALVALRQALQELADFQARAAAGTNLDDAIDQALRRIAEQAARGEFAAAAAGGTQDYQRWKAGETERRALERQAGISLLEATISQHLLTRTAEAAAAAAELIIEKLALEADAATAPRDAFWAEIAHWFETGEKTPGTMELQVAAALARAVLANPALQENDAGRSDWAVWQVWLGNALRTLGERQDDPSALVESIAAYGGALTVYTKAALPLQWAMTQNNLGTALRALGQRQNNPEALHDAIAAYRAALTVRTAAELPLDWAGTQNNLGNALSALGERQNNPEALNDAIAAFRAALTVYTSAASPLDWAMTQNGLGTSLRALGEREVDPATLDEAIEAHHRALTVYTQAALPLDWAMTQNNLGNALSTLGQRQSDPAALHYAIAAYRAALTVYTQVALPLQWAITQNGLGNALQTLGGRQDDPAALVEAITAYRAALTVRTHATLPLQWSMTQNNLGNALNTLGERQNDLAALVEAIAAYRAALTVRTQAALPMDWAMTQNNLGTSLKALGEHLDNPAALLDAIAAYEAGLTVFSQPGLEQYRGVVDRNLARARAALARLGG